MQNKYKKILFISIMIFLAGLVINYSLRKKVDPIYWQNNARQRYKIFCNSVIYAANQNAKPIHERIELRGILNFRIFEISADNIVAGLQFSPVEIRHAGKNDFQTEKIYSELFFINLTPAGRITKFEFSNIIAKRDENSIKDIVKSFQFIIKDTVFKKWQTVEEDSNGVYKASYLMDNNLLYKNKKEYSEIYEQDGFKNSNGKVVIKKSQLAVKYGKNISWFESIKSNELINFYSDSDMLLKVSSTIELFPIPYIKDDSLAIWKESLNYNSQIALWHSLFKNKKSLIVKKEQALYKKQFAGKDFNTIADNLFKKYSTYNIDCLKALISYLKYRPDSAQKFADYLMEKKLNPNQQIMLVHALGRVAHKQAQQSLVKIMNGDPFSEVSRTQAAIEFSAIENPEQAITDDLWNAYEKHDSENNLDRHIASTALLSLGSMAHNLEYNAKENYQNMSASIKNRIASELKIDVDLKTRVALLHAAGNTTDENLIESINYYCNDQDPRVRSAAVTSLAYMEDSKTNSILVEKLNDEANINVRNAIVTTLRKKKATDETVAAIINSIPTEENRIVKGEMYRYLLKHRNFAGVKDFLEDRIKQERALEHRRIIRTAISTRK